MPGAVSLGAGALPWSEEHPWMAGGCSHTLPRSGLVPHQPLTKVLGWRTVASQAAADGPGDAAVQATQPCVCTQSPPRTLRRKQALLLYLLTSHSLYFSLPCCWVTLFAQHGSTLFSEELKTKEFLLQT